MPEQLTAVQFETPVSLTHSEALAPNVPFAPESLGKIMISGMLEKIQKHSQNHILNSCKE